MKKTAYLFVIALFLLGTAVFAQGPFTDVPTDHWAYDAINQLQKDGLLIGYPDGTFAGKRTITRYEFAVALARLPLWDRGETDLSPFAKKSELENYAKKSDIPSSSDLSHLATKADVDAIRKLVDEFRDEIAALGVDVDALKRDVCALGARVEAIEAEMKRVRFTGDVNVFAIGMSSQGDAPLVDRDERVSMSKMMQGIGVVNDFDLNVVGRVNEGTTAYATINYGNYLNYIRYVDDYIDGGRPHSKNAVQAGKNFVDGFFPYWLYLDTAFSKGKLSVGRFPLQFTPYTLKKIDVDSYTTILKTDDGNYPVDGAMLGAKFGGVDVTLFAAKNENNDYLKNGLTGQPTAGPYKVWGLFNDAGGNSVGGLTGPISQSAGARAVVGTPLNGNVGITFYQAWSRQCNTADYDQARVYGADINLQVTEAIGFAGSWTRSDTLARKGTIGVGDITKNNTAWDAKVTGGIGKAGIGAGYKQIDHNFTAAGAWDKIGRWTNPTDIKGPYLDIVYPVLDNLKVMVNGEYLKPAEGGGSDKIIKAEGGVKWGFTKCNSIDVNYEWVKWDPNTAGESSAKESYLTIGLNHQLNPNAGLKIGYQMINYKAGTGAGIGNVYSPTGLGYKGGEGIVQFGVTF